MRVDDSATLVPRRLTQNEMPRSVGVLGVVKLRQT